MLRSSLIVITGAVVGIAAYSHAANAVIEELSPEVIAVAGTNVPDVAAPAEVVAVPVIEELVPATAPKVEAPVAEAPVAAAPEAKPAEVATPDPAEVVTPAPAEVVAPAAAPVDEMAPVVEPAKPEVKEEAAAPAAEPAKAAIQIPLIEELIPAAPVAAPAEKPAAMIEELAAPAEVTPPAAAPAEVPVAQAEAPTAPAPVATAPDAATKEALEAAIKATGSDDRAKLSTAVSQQEEVKRKSREIDGRKAMVAGDQAWKAGDYSAAAESYKLVLKNLPPIERFAKLRNVATQRLPECDYEMVRAMYSAGKYSEAVAKGEEFIKVRPDNPPLRKLIAKISSRPPDRPAGEVTAGEKQADSEVEKQMRQGREAMAGRDYGEARRRFESVLGIEPDHREAMRYLKVLGDREYGNKSVERDATARKMTADVRDTWNSKYKVIKGRPQAVSQVSTQSVSLIEDKMKKIIIDEVEFRQANMHDVVDFLNKRSRDCDKSAEDESKKGVNIIFNPNPGGPSSAAVAAPKPAADDPFGAPAAGAGGAASGVPEVTFSARYITLYNALKIITSVSGLKWRIDGDVVMIIPFDWDPATIEMRMYPVEPTFIERVKLTSSAMPAVTTVGGREMKGLEAGGNAEGVADLKESFIQMGMTFPKGSTINYNPGIGKVIVANTSDNLAIFEKLLGELNVVPMQVEIEAKFVEVNETDLYESGLEWLLTDNWEMLTKNNSNPYAPMTSNPRIQMNANSADGGFSRGLNFLGMQDGKSTAMSGGKGSMGAIASISGILTNPDLTVILHALEQNGNADLLSAPKVTARSGEQALIKVVTEYIYPTTFEVQGGQIGNSSGGDNNANVIQETTVVPQDFATREVGVILEVTPEVSQDGNMISLTMKPQVVTDPIWYQYGSTVRRADGSEQVLNMPQPFFQVRAIETKISIYDGATVAMGGLITESVDKINDKIPVLGDIPFIGALFRSKSEKSVKRNLLIFVTAKLVDPAGHLIRNQTPDTGAPAPSALAPAAAR
jgi:general secretion pathway protein D